MSEFAEEFDIGGEGAEKSAPDSLARLIDMSKELLKMEELVEQAEEDLKAMKSSLQLLRTGRIPDMMNEIGISSITVDDRVIEVSDFVSGSLPKDPEKRARAIAWLDSVGAGGLLKTEVTVEFGRNQHNEALSLAGELREKGHAMDVTSNVAPQTLLKFARDKLKAGEPIDFEALGLYTGKIAKVKGQSR
jgi:hypothetical protein